MIKSYRKIALLIVLVIMITGCSHEEVKTILIEDHGMALQNIEKNPSKGILEEKNSSKSNPKINLDLSIVDRIYEVNSFNEASFVEKVSVGWLDDQYLINWVLETPEKERGTKNKFLLNEHYSRTFVISGNKETSHFAGYLEKVNYETGEGEKILEIAELMATGYSKIFASNDGQKLLIMSADEDINLNRKGHTDEFWYKVLSTKGQVTFYDLKAKEKKIISDFKVIPYLLDGTAEWSNDGRYILFLKDVIHKKKNAVSSTTYKLGIYDTVLSELKEFNHSESFSSKPAFGITNGGKIFWGNAFIYHSWGSVEEDALYDLGMIIGGLDIIKDIDEDRILYKKDSSWYDHNLKTNTRKEIISGVDFPTRIYEVSKDGNMLVAYGEVKEISGVYLYQMKNDKLVGVDLVYKLNDDSHLINAKLSNDHKKLVITVNDHAEIKELVIELNTIN